MLVFVISISEVDFFVVILVTIGHCETRTCAIISLKIAFFSVTIIVEIPLLSPGWYLLLSLLSISFEMLCYSKIKAYCRPCFDSSCHNIYNSSSGICMINISYIAEELSLSDTQYILTYSNSKLFQLLSRL